VKTRVDCSDAKYTRVFYTECSAFDGNPVAGYTKPETTVIKL